MLATLTILTAIAVCIIVPPLVGRVLRTGLSPYGLSQSSLSHRLRRFDPSRGEG